MLSPADTGAEAYNDAQKNKGDAQKALEDAVKNGDSKGAIDAIKKLADATAKIDKITPSVDEATKSASESIDSLKDNILDILSGTISAGDMAILENDMKTLEEIAPMVPDQAKAAAAEIAAAAIAAKSDNPLITDQLDDVLEKASAVAAGDFGALAYNGEDEITLPWNESYMPDSLYTVMEIAEGLLLNTKGKTIIKALILISAAETGKFANEEVVAVTNDLINYTYKKPIYGTFALPGLLNGEYTLPGDIICESLGMRYVWQEKDGVMTATIARGAEYDVYTDGKTTYVPSGGKEKELGFKTEFSSSVCYLTESHLNEAYSGYKKFLPMSGYCVIYNDDHLKQAEDIVTAIMGES